MDLPTDLVAEPLPYIVARHRAALRLGGATAPASSGLADVEPWKAVHPGNAIVSGGAMASDGGSGSAAGRPDLFYVIRLHHADVPRSPR